MGDEKRKTVCEIDCPACDARIKIVEVTDVITPAVKADKKVSFDAEKVTKLSDF